MKTASLGVLLGVLVALCMPAGAASAHGALTAPVSRAAACGTEGGPTARSAACRAAIAASRPGAAAAWDNLRVAGVNGRDRATIPDGKLCSGGLAQYAGLDLARTDWPTTRVTPGATFTFRYRTTIPHEGTFRMYVTKPGYAAGRPLRWADLESKPFLSITDPRRSGGAYVLPGRLPTGRTGRHVVYTIWQNSSTPDTYYSCSDVVFASSARTSAPVAKSPEASPSAGVDGGSAGNDDEPIAAAGGVPQRAEDTEHTGSTEHPESTEHTGHDTEAAEEVRPSPVAAREPASATGGLRWPLIAGVALILGVLATVGGLALHYRPRPRHRRG